MDTLEDNYIDNSSSDIFKPRYLFRRYDSSGSSSSNSSSFSSNSVGSFQSGSRWPNDRVAQRKRTISSTISESKWVGEESLSSGKRSGLGDGVTNGNTHDESVDAEDECLLCSSVVNERQYYLWQSQYTKSSLCSRCSDDNEGMRYISFWGTPVYKMGSWRKRYRAGRTLDIDLSPLLEVLDRIDQIDTSMNGRKTTASATKLDENGNGDINYKDTCSTNLIQKNDVKESETYSLRRRRRLENRKRMENEIAKDQQHLNGLQEMKISENVTSKTYQTLENGKLRDFSDIDNDKSLTGCLYAQRDILNNERHKSDDGKDLPEDKKVDGDDNSDKTEFFSYETCQNFEHIDVIEPINFLQVSGQTITDPSDCLADLSDDRLFQEDSKATGDINTINLQRPKDFSSTENMIKYLKERRKSNYETFLAGLEPITNLRRCSTAEKDLVLRLKTKKTKTKKSYSSDNEDSEEEYRHSKVSTKKVDGTKGRFNIKNCKDDDPASGQVKFDIGSKGLDKILPTEKVLDLNEGNIAKKHIPKQFTHGSSSNEGDKCEKATFLDIKRRFEKLCSGDTEQSEHILNYSHSTKIPKEYFRSQHIEMSVKRKSSDFFENKYCSNDNSDDNNDNSDDTKGIYLKTVQKDDGAEIDERDSKYDCDDTECQNAEEKVINIDDLQLTTGLAKPAHDLKPLQESLSENIHDKSNIIIGENKSEKSLEIPYQEQKQNTGTNSTNITITVENYTNSDTSNTNNSRGTKPSNEEVSPYVAIEKRNSKDCRSNLEENRRSGEIFKNGEIEAKSSWGKVKQKSVKARESKYKQIIKEEEEEDSNPDIQRIKLKLRRRQKYDDSDSDTNEKDGTVMELDGSNDEVVDLCWRTRGYDRDFYMSRKSVTGSEILDRYKRAVSNRRIKKRAKRVTESEKVEKENGSSCGRHTASASELMTALDRAASCSERMTQRLKSQLERRDSSNSSS